MNGFLKLLWLFGELWLKGFLKKGFWRQSFLSDRKEKNGVGKIEREGSLV